MIIPTDFHDDFDLQYAIAALAIEEMLSLCLEARSRGSAIPKREENLRAMAALLSSMKESDEAPLSFYDGCVAFTREAGADCDLEEERQK